MRTSSDDDSMVRARGLRKQYGKDASLVRAVDGVDLDVAPGETLAVMGPKGCGKSTLLHVLGGLDRPSAGELWLAGRRIDQMSERGMAALRRDAVGFVFQAFHRVRHGLSRCRSRGNSVTWRTFGTPASSAVQRSSPIANPPCGGMPCRNTCRYPSNGAGSRPRSASAAR
jgi:ABC-type oligopeptide transport system ATPase subunit